jgi:hypothetical protein
MTREIQNNCHLDDPPHEAKGNCGTYVRFRTDLFDHTLVFRFRDAIQPYRAHGDVHFLRQQVASSSPQFHFADASPSGTAVAATCSNPCSVATADKFEVRA